MYGPDRTDAHVGHGSSIYRLKVQSGIGSNERVHPIKSPHGWSSMFAGLGYLGGILAILFY